MFLKEHTFLAGSYCSCRSIHVLQVHNVPVGAYSFTGSYCSCRSIHFLQVHTVPVGAYIFLQVHTVPVGAYTFCRFIIFL